MGNRYSVKAAESKSPFASFWKSNSDDQTGNAQPVSSVVAADQGLVLASKGAGDAPAASPDAKPMPPASPPPVSPDDPRTIVSSLPSFPGTWNEVHKVKELIPMPFDGIRATFNKGLSHHFQVSHSFNLATMNKSSYKFGATYAGAKQLSQTETFPILTGEIDPSGNLTAQCLHAFSKQTRSRLVAQHQDGQFQAIELGTDYRGPNTTLSLTVANPDLLAQTGIYIAHGLYAATPNLALGVEALMQRGLHPAIGRVATQLSGSLVARYREDSFNAAVQISPLELGLHASYYHKLAENQAIGVELEGRGAAGECATTLAYSLEIPGADCTVKASIDTSLNITTTLEKKLFPLPMTLTLSCQGNQKKAQYLAGIGISSG